MGNNQKPLPAFPFRIEFEVNGICNLNCTYCYARPFNLLNPPLDRIEYLFRKTKDEADPFEVVVLGGEPFARKDIIVLFEHAMNIFQSRRIGVSTNGTLLDRLCREDLTRLKDLVDSGFSIQVTLDSVDKKVNDAVRGKTELTLSGLDVLETNNIPFIIGLVLTTANRTDIVDSVTALSNKYNNLIHLNLEALQPTVVLGERYFDLRLSGEEMRDIYYRVKDAVREAGRNDITVSGVVDNCENIKNDAKPLIDTYGFKTCLAGLTRAGVYPDGGVTPCTTLRQSAIGNLYFESWEEIWSKARDRFEKLDMVGGQCQINVHLGEKRVAPLEVSRLLRDKTDKKRVKVGNQ